MATHAFKLVWAGGKLGDGIMSAINCNVKLGRVAHPDRNRVKVTIEGKFLSCQW